MDNNNVDDLDKNFDYERKTSKHRNVAVVGLRDKNNRILLIRNRRLPGRWQPIGGGVEENELPIEAIIREAKEEANILLNPEKVFEVAQIPYDFGEGIIYFYESTFDLEIDSISFNKIEILEYGWFLLEEAKNLPLFNATSRFIDILIEKELQ